MEVKINRLEKKINFYSTMGWIFVISAVAPIGFIGFDVLIEKNSWPEDDLGSFIGGVSGTLAALAGVFFVFVAFLGQRISIIQQQIEIQNNIKELRDTREEIRGQKEQLQLQNKQFQIQTFESGLYVLINNLLSDSRKLLPMNPKEGLLPFLKDFESNYRLKFIFENIDPPNSMDPSEREFKLEHLPKLYLDAFYPSVRGLLSVIKSFVGILLFIDRSLIADKVNYHNLLFSQLTQAEIRVYFYGYFHEGFQLMIEEKKLISQFFLKFKGRDLIHERDIQLLEN